MEQHEQQELLTFFHKQLHLALVRSIQQESCDTIATLKKSKGYAAFADLFIPGLHLYYRQGISLKEIAGVLKKSGFSALSTDLKPRRPEAIWLDPEQFEQVLVHPVASPLVDEAGQWQLYLNALALMGFEQWLQKFASSHFIDRTQCINEVGAIYNLRIDEFKLNLIIKEHVLDEYVMTDS